MIEILRTKTFLRWFDNLLDLRAKRLILSRIDRLSAGSFGDVKSVGGGVFEMRVHHGPGYRLYACRRGERVILLLCGGDKSSQQRDITDAQRMASETEHET